MAVEDFCVAPGRNALAPGEFLVALRFPPPGPRSGSRFLRFIPRNEMDIAVVNSAVALSLDDAGRVASARIALGAVAPTPLFVPAAGAALVGAEPTPEVIERAAAGGARRGEADHRHARLDRATRPPGGRPHAARPRGRAGASEGSMTIGKRALVTTTINGDQVEFLCEPRQSLLEVLRDELRLTGTKEGCNNGNCGACTRHPRWPARQLLPACSASRSKGTSIQTIEGSPRPRGCIRCSRRSSNTRRCSAASARRGSSSPPRRCSTATPTPTEAAGAPLAGGQPLPLHRLRQDRAGGAGGRRARRR